MRQGTDTSENVPVASEAARWTRVAAHAAILFLAAVLLRDVLRAEGVRMWPDQGFPLLVVTFATVTALPALVRSLRLEAPDWGDNIAGALSSGNRWRLGGFAAIWVAYGLTLPLIGFLVASTLAMAASCCTLARTRPWIALPVCALVAVVVFVAFQRGLYVGLPLGPLDRFVIESLPRG